MVVQVETRQDKNSCNLNHKLNASNVLNLNPNAHWYEHVCVDIYVAIVV